MTMESKDDLKQIDIKNCMYYYLDDLDINFKSVLLDKRSNENKYQIILIYEISC